MISSPFNPISSDADSETVLNATLDQLPTWAERASRFARLGNPTAAKKLISELRARNKAFNPVLTGWILLAEAIIDRSEFLSAGSIEKFRRAYAIGVASNNLNLKVNSAAWLGAAEFGVRNIEAAVKYSGEALNIGGAEHGAMARALVVAGDCFNYAGKDKKAREFYFAARNHAIADGDISMQSVLIYNSAAFRVCRISLEDAFAFPLNESPADVELSICSSENLDKGLNNESLWPLIMLLRAQLRVVQRNWSEAIKLFESVLPKAILRGEHGWQMRLRADFAYCYANTMEYDIALKHIERLEGHIEVTVAIDDLAATYARLAFSSKLIGDSNRYEKNMALANKYLDEFQKSQVAILPLLNVAFPELN